MKHLLSAKLFLIGFFLTCSWVFAAGPVQNVLADEPLRAIDRTGDYEQTRQNCQVQAEDGAFWAPYTGGYVVCDQPL